MSANPANAPEVSTALLDRLWRPKPRSKPDPMAHLLGRAGYGFTMAELDLARDLGSEGWIERQLAPELLNSAPLEASLANNLPTLAMTAPEIIAFSEANNQQFRAVYELRTATLARRLYSPAQLYEVMVEFWSDHFSVFHLEGPVRYLKTVEDRTAIRPHALGRFVDLLKASARSPAMLIYLDNAASQVGAPNENYSRELMELHTLGVQGGYTEQDVAELARILTGWSIDRRSLTFRFQPTIHDFEAKQFLGQSFPAGGGLNEGDAALEMLAAHPSTARFVATKLIRRLVSDTPQPDLVDRVAALFLDTGGEIRPLLREIFSSPEFHASGDQKFRRPTELILAALRATGAETVGDFYRPLDADLGILAHQPFMWSPPNGYPDVQGYWLNTGALLARWGVASRLADGYRAAIRIDWPELAGHARAPVGVVENLSSRLLQRTLASEDRALLVAVAEAAGDRAPVEVGMLLLASPYFQSR